MAIPLLLMAAHQESDGGAVKASTRNSNAPTKAVGRAIQEPSICKQWPSRPVSVALLLTGSFYSSRHQLNHTPKQIYNCDFPDCVRTFVRLDLCNRHRDRHNVKGSQLHRKDYMLGHGSPVAENPMPPHGSTSPEVMRPSIKSRTDQLQYQSSQEMNPNLHSPVANLSSRTYSGAGSSNGTENFAQTRCIRAFQQ